MTGIELGSNSDKRPRRFSVHKPKGTMHFKKVQIAYSDPDARQVTLREDGTVALILEKEDIQWLYSSNQTSWPSFDVGSDDASLMIQQMLDQTISQIETNLTRLDQGYTRLEHVLAEV